MIATEITITKRKMSFEETNNGLNYDSPIKDENGNEVGKIINSKHEDSRIVLNEDCPKYIVELFTMQVTQKRTPEVTIRK